FGEHDLGWLRDTQWIQFSAVAIVVAFGHSLLAMSGFETLAQVYREIAAPKLHNLKITANIVCGFALVGTGAITLLAGMIIPDSIRPEYVDNLQVATIVASRGNVKLLGEAYAFGVVWSFFMKALGVLVLRFRRHDQEYKTPLNIMMGDREIPIGLFLTTFTLFLVALANLFSKQIATISGVGFTLLLFATFTISSRLNSRTRRETKQGLEQFNLDVRPEITAGSGAIHARPACILVAVRNYNR